ncbi:rna-directed dna polymerase from mobile element jockey-like [Limosa lapponica baueri]|uniref:Rna-directed dna polymerase from mobile element jockey-like n=1 Tax=Limosa lapponica baueri TaxID=1758121 RepID=A0A2I0TB96_LIMLA|nr:rna-directed dna polymerase from mobile element jockey-like [Limosa lapponica baueri]
MPSLERLRELPLACGRMSTSEQPSDTYNDCSEDTVRPFMVILLDKPDFCDKVALLVDEGKVVEVVYLDFSKALDTVSHSILLEKLAAHGLDESTLRWVKNCLEGQAQRVVVNGVKVSW